MDNRYYFEGSHNIGEIVALDKNETSHLFKVRRAKIGDTIVGFCGDGYDYTLIIEQMNKTATCKVVNKTLNKGVEITPVTVYLATLKNDALNEAIDNLTQLNVKSIILFDSKFSVATIDEDKLDKLTTRSIQACKQCERADKVNISSTKFNDMVSGLNNYDLVLFAYENTSKPYINNLSLFKGKNIAIIIGCEGGFSVEEAEIIQQKSTTVSLGKTILRAPVACTALTSAVMASLGEWEN